MKLKKLKKELLSSIEEVCRESDDIVLDPKKDFTRTRKLPLREVIRCTVAMGGNSLKHELLDILGYSPDIATSSAFVQQRTKLKPEALKRVMAIPAMATMATIATTMFFIWVPLSAVNKNPVRCPEQTDTVHSIARVLPKLNG